MFSSVVPTHRCKYFLLFSPEGKLLSQVSVQDSKKCKKTLRLEVPSIFCILHMQPALSKEINSVLNVHRNHKAY